jgi:hypothetical protein
MKTLTRDDSEDPDGVNLSLKVLKRCSGKNINAVSPEQNGKNSSCA